MHEKQVKRARLNPEDRERMRLLSAEVRTRLQEMASIFSRTLDRPLDGNASIKFAPRVAETSSPESERGTQVEIVCSDAGCGCYVDPPGLCEFPCGAAGSL